MQQKMWGDVEIRALRETAELTLLLRKSLIEGMRRASDLLMGIGIRVPGEGWSFLETRLDTPWGAENPETWCPW